MRRYLAGLAALALMTSPVSAGAQDRAPDTAQNPAQDADRVDDIIVTARRAGAPMWTVTRGDSTVILVGAISGVPRDFAWRPEALEEATRRSRRILYPTVGQASVSDVLRLMWRIRTIARLPQGTTSADFLPPGLQARLEAVMAGEGDDWRTKSFVGLSFDLLEKAGSERRTSGAVDAVRRAAREARVPGEPIGTVRGDELIEGLISDPPSQYISCVAAAVTAAEEGPEGARARLEAWRSLRVPEVLATGLDLAYARCWPSGDPEIAPMVREQWRVAADTALDQPGVTMGVAPLRILAEPGGVLDQLEAEGADILGPDWKPS